MPDIAKLDADGMLIAVETVSDDDHKTDARARIVQLDPDHDMRGRLKKYRYDFNRGYFVPMSTEPLEVAERDTSELVEGLVEAVEDLYEEVLKRDPPQRTKRAMKSFRRHTPRRGKQSIEIEAPVQLVETPGQGGGKP